jgi:hypothetical protein
MEVIELHSIVHFKHIIILHAHAAEKNPKTFNIFFLMLLAHVQLK